MCWRFFWYIEWLQVVTLYCCFSHLVLHMWEYSRHVRCDLLMWALVDEGMCGGSPLCLICWHVLSCYQIHWGTVNSLMQGRCRNPLVLFGTMICLCWLCCVSSPCFLMVSMGWLHSQMLRWRSPMLTFLGWLSLGKRGWLWALYIEVVCLK